MKQPASLRSTRVKLALLPLLALSACITPAPVGPRPVFAPDVGNAANTTVGPLTPPPQSPTPATPTPSDSPSPSPTDPATPNPTPSDANSPTPVSSAGPCDTSSNEISFVVYANGEDRDLHYAGTELDTRTPLKGTILGLGSISENHSDYRFSVPRASLKNGFDIRHAGYWPLSGRSGESLCASMYVGLSPLSAEEQTGQAVSMENADLYAVGTLPPFMQHDEASNFSYAVLRDRSAANPLLNWLAQNDQGATRSTVDKALDAGRMVVLFSNNSSQMGDISSVIQSAIETPTSLILASHDSGMTQYPKPGNGSYGDIFNKRLEIKLLPRSDKKLIFDAHRAGVNSAKVRLEAK